MSSTIGRKAMSAAAGGAPRFQSALKKLSQHGVEALMPQRNVSRTDEHKMVWHGPAISNRIANVLRKTAKLEGTYGAFNAETLTGWDPQWDVDLEIAKVRGRGRHRLAVPKKTKRTRTREMRAQKIEENMQGMAERIEQFHADKHANKPAKTFELKYKKLMRQKGSK